LKCQKLDKGTDPVFALVVTHHILSAMETEKYFGLEFSQEIPLDRKYSEI